MFHCERCKSQWEKYGNVSLQCANPNDIAVPITKEAAVFFEVGMNYYRPQTKLRKGNVFTPVCQSFCSREGVSAQGVYHSMHWERPPWQTPLLGRHPLVRHPLPRRSLQRTVHILQECILVVKEITSLSPGFILADNFQNKIGETSVVSVCWS